MGITRLIILVIPKLLPVATIQGLSPKLQPETRFQAVATGGLPVFNKGVTSRGFGLVNKAYPKKCLVMMVMCK